MWSDKLLLSNPVNLKILILSASTIQRFLAIFGMTILVGIGAYALAWQFNDGKITQSVMAFVFVGMSFPSLIIGGVMRMFRPELQRYFAVTAGICLLIAVILFMTR